MKKGHVKLLPPPEDVEERVQLAFTLGPWSGDINAHRRAFKDVPETCPKVGAIFNDLVSGMMQVFGPNNLDREQWRKIIDLKGSAEVQIKELTMALRGALIRAHDDRIKAQACSAQNQRVEQPHGPDHTTV